MATLPTRSFSQIVNSMTAGMQGRTQTFLNFSTGSVFLAIVESVAGALLWLQKLVISFLELTRLSTSEGADADSFVADFGIVTRIGPVAANGPLVYSRITPSGATPLVPVGATAQTSDGKQSFSVYADPANVNYSAAKGGYVMPAQVSSITVPAVSTTPSTLNLLGAPGANGNVSANTITQISSSVPGIDTVTNPAAFTNGSDGETDPQLRARFKLGVASLSRATSPSLKFAVKSVQTGLQVEVLSGYNVDGTFNPGMTSVIVDDGSGFVSDALLVLCRAAVANYVAAGVRFGVYRAIEQDVRVALNVIVKSGYVSQDVRALVKAAIASKINGLGLGVGVDYFAVGKWALDVPGVSKVENLVVNGGTSDLGSSPRLTYKCSGVVAS